MVYREETLLNVMKSVTRNGRSILLTALLAIILVYLFSIIGFIFFKDDFLVEADQLAPANRVQIEDEANGTCDADGGCPQDAPEEAYDTAKERSCDSLRMCIVTTLNQGLRNGGGIGDVLRPPSLNEPLFPARVIYDMIFFFVLIIIVLTLIFGVIIYPFADLFSETPTKEHIFKNSCFICGLTLLLP